VGSEAQSIQQILAGPYVRTLRHPAARGSCAHLQSLESPTRPP
jgi:hypothetical protein